MRFCGELTDLTLVRSLPRVHPLVRLQPGRGPERGRAGVAQVGALAAVGAKMVLEANIFGLEILHKLTSTFIGCCLTVHSD